MCGFSVFFAVSDKPVSLQVQPLNIQDMGLYLLNKLVYSESFTLVFKCITDGIFVWCHSNTFLHVLSAPLLVWHNGVTFRSHRPHHSRTGKLSEEVNYFNIWNYSNVWIQRILRSVVSKMLTTQAWWAECGSPALTWKTGHSGVYL